MKLQIGVNHTDAAINGLLTTLAALPSLTRLSLELSALEHEPSLDLKPRLLHCLLHLDLDTFNGYPPTCIPAQVDQIRLTLGHLRRINAEYLSSDKLPRYLQPSANACWQDIGCVHADAGTGVLLIRLPSLIKLDLSYFRCRRFSGLPTLNFLSQLPLLAVLRLYTCKEGKGFTPTDDVLAALVHCTGLIDLTITCQFNSTQWSTLFAELTKLKKLTLYRGPETLQCFTAGPITQSLEELILPAGSAAVRDCPSVRSPPSPDDQAFSPAMDSATIDRLSPPTSLFSSLTHSALRENPRTTTAISHL